MGAEESRSAQPKSTQVEELSAELSSIRDSIYSLQSQVNGMQENSQGEMRSLRREVSELATSVRFKCQQLQAQNQQLQAQIDALNKKPMLPHPNNGMHTILSSSGGIYKLSQSWSQLYYLWLAGPLKIWLLLSLKTLKLVPFFIGKASGQLNKLAVPLRNKVS